MEEFEDKSGLGLIVISTSSLTASQGPAGSFEVNVKTALNVSKNPFELIYEGELDKQG